MTGGRALGGQQLMPERCAPPASVLHMPIDVVELTDRRWKHEMQLTAVYIAVAEGYVAFVDELPGANTQEATLKEARENLQEAASLVMEANRELSQKSIAGKQVTKEPFVLGSQ